MKYVFIFAADVIHTIPYSTLQGTFGIFETGPVLNEAAT